MAHFKNIVWVVSSRGLQAPRTDRWTDGLAGGELETGAPERWGEAARDQGGTAGLGEGLHPFAR